MTTATAPVATTDAVAAGRFLARLADELQQAGAMAVVGAGSGLIALGAGSRAAMRLAALSSGQIGSGVRPESGAVPGELTVGGTMFLLVSGTFVGMVIAVFVAMLLARWLPSDGWQRTAVVAAASGLVPMLFLVDPGNRDFARFGPQWFVVPLFLACAAGFGMLVGRLSRTRTHPVNVVARGALMVLGTFALGVTVMASSGGGSVLIGGPLALALITARLLPSGGRFGWWHGPVVQRGGEWLLVAVAVFAVGMSVVRAGQILLR